MSQVFLPKQTVKPQSLRGIMETAGIEPALCSRRVRPGIGVVCREIGAASQPRPAPDTEGVIFDAGKAYPLRVSLMPRPVRGSIYRESGGTFGIRWPEDGHRPQKGGFQTEAEARAWFAANVGVALRPFLADACGAIRDWARRGRWVWDTDSWVYVVAAPEIQRIKIGVTVQPRNRLRELRTGSPTTITPLLMMPGGDELEDELLRVTKPWAIQGAGTEWRTIEALEVVLAYVRGGAAGDFALTWKRREGNWSPPRKRAA